MATNEDIKGEVKLLAEAELFRTPAKKRKGERGEDPPIKPFTSVVIGSYQRTLPEVGTAALEALIAQGSPSLERGGLARIVSRLETSTFDLGQSLGEVAGLSQGRFEENEASMVLVSGAVQNIMAALGTSVEMDPKFEAPTLWGVASFVGDEVIRLGEEVEHSSVGLSHAQQALGILAAKVSATELSKPQEEEALKQILTFVMERVQGVSGELDLIRNHITRLAESKADKSTSPPKRQKVLHQGSTPPTT